MFASHYGSFSEMHIFLQLALETESTKTSFHIGSHTQYNDVLTLFSFTGICLTWKEHAHLSSMKGGASEYNIVSSVQNRNSHPEWYMNLQ